MSRALVIVLDSVGIGNAPDAEAYGDAGANTLGHIVERVPDLRLPTLESLGLGELVALGGTRFRASQPKTEKRGRAEARPSEYRASYGRMRERSAGKDTTTGHWEIAGVVVEEPFATFEHFPDELVRRIERDADVQFIGNYPRSGTTIIEELGPEHVRTGKPILYTSADSVMQIAAHEEVMPTQRLYQVCEIARRHANNARIGRVIARPFTGEIGKFRRTPRRHDYSMKPPPTILDRLKDNGTEVIGIGKISDIFAGQGITQSFSTTSNAEGMERIAEQWARAENALLFANLVDFDMLFGHRRDVTGYAQALREFDHWLSGFPTQVTNQDLVIITADHGNDPTFHGSDHTREEVPLFMINGSEPRDLGTRETFADVAATLADYFELPKSWPAGTSLLQTNECMSRR